MWGQRGSGVWVWACAILMGIGMRSRCMRQGSTGVCAAIMNTTTNPILGLKPHFRQPVGQKPAECVRPGTQMVIACILQFRFFVIQHLQVWLPGDRTLGHVRRLESI